MEKTVQTPSTNLSSAAAAEERVPADWQGAFGAYKYSKLAVRRNVGVLIVLCLIYLVVGGASSIKRLEYLSLPGSLLLGTLLTGAIVTVLLAGVRGKTVSFEDAIKRSFSQWLKMIGLALLMYLVLGLSLLLFIIPFFFVLPRTSLAIYFLIDKKMGVIDAFKASWDATKGHSLKIWGIVGVGILIALLALTIIGIPFAIYFTFMYSAAVAVLYEYLRRKAPAVPATPAADPAV